MLRFKILASAVPLFIAAIFARGELLPGPRPCIAIGEGSVQIAAVPWQAELHVSFTHDPALATVRVQISDDAGAADTYDAGGLSFGAGGDGVRLWNDTTANANDLVASVDFGAADNGVTFNYDPISGQFGSRSQLGVNGVFSAASSPNDIGSPGRILAPAVSPTLRIALSGDQIRIEFDTAVGRRYHLEVRNDFTTGTWTPTTDMFQATSNGVGFFEKSLSGSPRFYRVLVE